MRLRQAVAQHLRDCQSDVATTIVDRVTTEQEERSSLDQIVRAIPFKRASKSIPFVYVCAIAHRLATPSQPAALIAAQLVDALLQPLPIPEEDSLSGIVVQPTAIGLLQFELSDRAIASWLDRLLTKALPQQSWVRLTSTERQMLLPTAAIFEVQYAYARCCSLLRLAHSEGLITLDRLDVAPLAWRVVNPPSVPWLTSTAQLCLNHPVDRRLLGYLVEALDCLSNESPHRVQQSLRSAQAIAQAMQAFHRVHPLWRKTGTEPNLVVSQLGLLLATQRILYVLLADGLNLQPVVEL
ncbi:hypothetical protein H6F86_24270 [Phormidium sp. FACHB-592]|uniref:DALR anticodon binding domain-containing protein n=1 Tax=Stenomitos frigidus AS-A4 TaxID=2933935 RepID=A0ABV0KK96_9CYAN|nr:hypothetical protein [Phormidium sp. FACHB-592]MBD2076944.1 hypothetical protein [Phormidium sp. FACHB-592]